MAGKFRNDVEQKVYELSLDGVDDDCGSVDTGGWAGFMRLSPMDMAISGSDKGFAIVTEDEQGFVEVEFYDEDAVAGLWWDKLVASREGNTITDPMDWDVIDHEKI